MFCLSSFVFFPLTSITPSSSFILLHSPSSSSFILLPPPSCAEESVVLQQLQYTGMLETIRIRKEGFATRMPFEDLLTAYRGAVFEFHRSLHPTASNATKLMTACEAKQKEICLAKGLVSGASALPSSPLRSSLYRTASSTVTSRVDLQQASADGAWPRLKSSSNTGSRMF